MLSVVLFLGGLFGIIVQFCFSGFLLYAPDDCWAFVGVCVVLSLWILSNHVRYLQHTYALAAGCTASFAERYCDGDGEVKADVINPLLKAKVGEGLGAYAGGVRSVVQSGARTETSATT